MTLLELKNACEKFLAEGVDPNIKVCVIYKDMSFGEIYTDKATRIKKIVTDNGLYTFDTKEEALANMGEKTYKDAKFEDAIGIGELYDEET